MGRATRQRVLAATIAVAVCLGAYLLWPARTLDATEIDSALPTASELMTSAGRGEIPLFVQGLPSFDGALAHPLGGEGRVTLADGDLDEQCLVWNEDGDDWACRDLRGVGMVALASAFEVTFQAQSTILAYDGKGAAKKAWSGLVADIRENEDDGASHTRDLGDDNVIFEIPGGAVAAIRIDTVVIEVKIWDRTSRSEMSIDGENVLVEAWFALQTSKVQHLLD